VAKSKSKTPERARYSVGIDLGTTNCTLARASLDAEAGAGSIDVLPIAQLVEAGEVADRTLLPSFAYIVGDFDFPAGSLRLPWGGDDRPPQVVGELARKRGFDWLLNIDSDELFFSPDESADQHFAALSKQPIETIVYLNYEAMPERDDIGDFFREVDLFKVPPELNRRPITAEIVRAVKATPQFNPDFFHFYGAGKSALRLSASGMQPNGVHSFVRRVGQWQAAESRRHTILHYACCGFDAFWNKYVTLGRFSDQWWEKYDIAASIGRFHLDARDVVARGSPDAARAFYRERVAMEDKERVDALIKLGVLARFPQPRQIIQAATGR